MVTARGYERKIDPPKALRALVALVALVAPGALVALVAHQRANQTRT